MFYLDSSAVMQWITGKVAWPLMSALDDAVSSELLRVECRRAFNRLRGNGEINDEGFLEFAQSFDALYDHISVVALNATILDRAADAFPTTTGTLDAIHLATAILLQARDPEVRLKIISDDYRLALCARALGFSVLGSTFMEV